MPLKALRSATGNDPSSNKWIGLIAASAGMFLGFLDITVNVALPDITSSFATDLRTIQWIIVLYVGTTTGLQLGLGSAADIYGLKRFFIIGVAIYTLAVLLIGIAPSLPVVFGLRVLQAVGNGLILVSAPALVTSIFPSEERGRGLGFMTGLATLGGITGTLLGGLLVDTLGWNAIFLVRVPLGLLVIVLSLVGLQERRSSQDNLQFDLRGAVILFIGIASFILFLTLGGRIGWIEPAVLLLIVLSLVSLSAFAYFNRRVSRPVVDLSMFRSRVLSLGVLVSFLMFMTTFVNWFILPFYVSDVMGVNARTWGFLLMLVPALSSVSAPVGGWLSDRMPPAYLTTLALVILAATMLWFVTLNANSSVTDVALRMAATGLGTGIFQASVANLIMGTVPADRLGTGGAILAISRSMGTVTSVAIMSAVFASRLDLHTASAVQQGTSTEIQAFVMAFKDTYLVSGLLAGLATLISLGFWPMLMRKQASQRTNTSP